VKILILGGYGVFGGRLATLLSDISELELLICGRSAQKAEAFCAGFKGSARVTPVALNRDDIAEGLADLRPDVVVDASGPFQAYGTKPYVVIEACIAAGVDYLDLADGADFVFGVSDFDERAKQAGVVVLSGVSSFPVLTAAVLRRISQTLVVEEVEAGIAPSPHAGIGLNVMRAVVGYAGAPVTLWRDGEATTAPGLAESRRYTVAVPGRLPLRSTRFSLVDVPDLRVIPPQHPTLRSIWVGAGPVPESLHRMLNMLAKARALLRLPSLALMAGVFYRVLNLLAFGEHRGGMYVHATGQRDGRRAEVSWHLLAEGDDGPFIPSMAIECLIRKMLQGERPATGARAATQALELEDYEAVFARRTIFTGLRGGDDPTDPLYLRTMGSAFATLPAAVQALHGTSERRVWQGLGWVPTGGRSRCHCGIGTRKRAGALDTAIRQKPVPFHAMAGHRPEPPSADGAVRDHHRRIGIGNQ